MGDDNTSRIQQLHMQQSACQALRRTTTRYQSGDAHRPHERFVDIAKPIPSDTLRRTSDGTVLLRALGVLVEHEGGDGLAVVAREHRHRVDGHGLEEHTHHGVVRQLGQIARLSGSDHGLDDPGADRISLPLTVGGPFVERQGLAVTLKFDGHGGGDVAAGRADLDAVFAGLHVPVGVLLGPVGERALVEVDGDGLRLARLEEHLDEAL